MLWFSDIRTWVAKHTRFLQWIVAGVTLLLAGNIVLNSIDDLAKLKRFSPEQVVVLLAVFTAYLTMRAYSSLIVLRSVGDLSLNFWSWIKIYIVGRFANLLFAQSGNVYRATVLKGRHSVSYSEYIDVNVFYVWLDSLLSLLMTFVLTLSTQTSTEILGFDIRALAGILSAAVLAAPFAANALLKVLPRPRGIVSKALRFAQGVFAFTLARGTDLPLIGRFVALDLVQFGIWVLLYRVTLEGMGITAKLVDLVLFLAIYKLSTFLVITPGNIGVREIAYAFLGEAIGIGMAEGVLVSTVIRVATYAVILPLGLVFGGAHLSQRRKEGRSPHSGRLGRGE